MKLVVPILFVVMTAGSGNVASQEAAPATDSASDQQRKACSDTGSDLVIAQCENLRLEFNTTNAAKQIKLLADGSVDFSSVHGISLADPTVVLGAFIVGVRKRAYAGLVSNTLSGDAKAAAQGALNQFAQLVSTKAAVNQSGANTASTGSTSLVTKPTTTDLISLAAESGAFTDTLNGNTLTVQANADGLIRYFSNKPFADLEKPKLADTLLEHLTVTATFSVAQSGSTGVKTSGSATSGSPSVSDIVLPSNNVNFNTVSANLAVVRPYVPNSKKFNKAWKDAEKPQLAALSSAETTIYKARLKLQPVVQKVESTDSFKEAEAIWLKNAKADEENGDFNKFVSDYKTYTDAFEAGMFAPTNNVDPTVTVESQVLDLNSDIASLSSINGKILDQARGTLFTLNYTYNTPPNKPATHTGTLILAKVFQNSNGRQLTANAAGTWFDSVPKGAKYGKAQSYQFSGEFDQPMGGTATAPRATFSLAGYGQYQYNPTVLKITSGNVAPGTDITLNGNAQVLLGTAGWIGVAQSKLSFNIGKGMTIPVAVKWSNKTDLVPSNDWKGQFGVSYDLSAFSSMLSGLK